MKLTVAQLVGLLLQIKDQTLPVIVLAEDGVEELAFSAPILTLENPHSPFVAINVKVEP